MNTVLIFLGAQLLFSLLALWGFLAMAHWSDRQLAIAWQQLQKSKVEIGSDLD